MPDTHVTIRPARPHEAPALAAVHCAAALAGFAHIFPPEAPKPTPGSLLPSWEEVVADPAASVLVAEGDGQVVGSAAVRPDPAEPGATELERLHVHPDWWYRGVGSALHDAAIEAAAGDGPMTLRVLEGNQVARAMYERRGWRLLPGRLEGPAGVPVVRYRLELGWGRRAP